MKVKSLIFWLAKRRCGVFGDTTVLGKPLFVDSLTLNHSQVGAGSANLYRLVVLRGLAIVLQLVTLAVAVLYLQLALPLFAITVVIAIYIVLTIYTWLHSRRVENVDSNEFFLHLLADITILTALLYFSGGAANPFIVLYLLPITVAIVLLPARHIWLLAATTAICYTFLLWQYVPVAHSHGGHNEFNVHIIGMWFSFVITAILISYFVVAMRSAMQQQQAALNEAREGAMRDEQLVTLGTLAASTAHELGTPLGTMALLLDELADKTVSTQEKSKTIDIMRGQVRRCRDALTTLSASAGGVRLAGGTIVRLDQYIEALCGECDANRPRKPVALTIKGSAEAPRMVIDRSLSQAIMNIIDNAQKVSERDVKVVAAWNAQTLDLSIQDDGPGVPETLQDSIGKAPITMASDGLGLGLFLAHSVIRRFGGKVSLQNRQVGGTLTLISLPLPSLRA